MTPENEKNSATGNRQSDFAGTNPNKYGPPKSENEQDNPIEDEAAQNVTDGAERISGDEAAEASNKANQNRK
jgi:hypothetical protein